MGLNITAPACGASSGSVSTLNRFKYARGENKEGNGSVVDIKENVEMHIDSKVATRGPRRSCACTKNET